MGIGFNCAENDIVQLLNMNHILCFTKHFTYLLFPEVVAY